MESTPPHPYPAGLQALPLGQGWGCGAGSTFPVQEVPLPGAPPHFCFRVPRSCARLSLSTSSRALPAVSWSSLSLSSRSSAW